MAKTRKTRSDYGTKRPLTTQEGHLENAKNLLAQALEEMVLAAAVSPITDNRRAVKKSAKKRARHGN